MDSNRQATSITTAAKLGRIVDANLANFARQTFRELDYAMDREHEIAIATMGLALCRARAIVRRAMEEINRSATV